MWKKLEAVSPGRSILLTVGLFQLLPPAHQELTIYLMQTHSMEEANALASRAGIMSKRMLAMGTTDSLRHKFGDVYYVHLVTTTAPHTPADEMERIRAWIVEHIPDATIEEKTYHGQMRFAVPARSGPDLSSPTPAAQSNEKTEPAVDEIQEVSPISTNTSITQQNKNSKTELVDEIKEISQPVIDIKDYDGSAKTGNISALFTLLEANKALLGLEYYSVSQTTLDQVFLKIVGQHQIEEEGYAAPPARGLWMRLFSRS
jgi:ABC-type multidrug transport system ATPase subunit